MPPDRRAVLEQALREGWSPVVGINLYEVAEQDWQQHLELVRQLGPAPRSWLDSGARIHLLAAWRGPDSRHVLWVNWFPTADTYLAGAATPDEEELLNSWRSLIHNREWHVGEDLTQSVTSGQAGAAEATRESGADSLNRATVERLVQALNNGDARGFADCFTEDAVVRWMRSDRVLEGRPAVTGWIDEAVTVFDQLSNEIVGIYSDGQRVVLEVVAHGTQIRASRGAPAGRILNQHEVYVYEFRDGRISEARCY